MFTLGRFQILLKHVYVEFGLYEVHMEDMRPSNSMIVGGCGD